MAVVSLLNVTATQILAAKPPSRRGSDTGFSLPFSGADEYEYLAPTQATDPGQINQPIGQPRADQIARKLGLKKKNTLTEEQYVEFISGGGHGGDPASAELADASVRIFTNTIGRPLCYDSDPNRVCTVLASYGLFVDEEGLLMSLANLDAPTRKANELLTPTGYVNKWFFANGATSSLVQLYSSAYPVEVFFGGLSQQWPGSDPAQLVTNTKAGETIQVGMSMAPALWLTNFALLYTLNPEVAAEMPAYWTPIPGPVANAILASENGWVLFSDYASYFEPTNFGQLTGSDQSTQLVSRPVPEPTSIALLLAGLMGYGLVGRRQKIAAAKMKPSMTVAQAIASQPSAALGPEHTAVPEKSPFSAGG